ncbi:MAG: transporter associated domain-containing protein [Nitrospirota bacterium]
MERADGSWLAAGSMPLDEFIDSLELGNVPEKEKWSMNTLGGFVMAMLGVLPSEGQSFAWRGLKFEVVDMDGRRVDKVLVSRIPEQNDAGKEA